jgi:hypothetical protein
MLDGATPEKRANAKSKDSTSQVRDVKSLEKQHSFQGIKRIAATEWLETLSRERLIWPESIVTARVRLRERISP